MPSLRRQRNAVEKSNKGKKDLPHPLRLLHMRYLTLLALALLLCSSAAFCQTNGTTPEDLNASALRALVVDSSASSNPIAFL